MEERRLQEQAGGVEEMILIFMEGIQWIPDGGVAEDSAEQGGLAEFYGGRIREAERVGDGDDDQRRLGEESRRNDSIVEALIASDEEDGSRNRVRAVEAEEVIVMTLEAGQGGQESSGDANPSRTASVSTPEDSDKIEAILAVIGEMRYFYMKEPRVVPGGIHGAALPVLSLSEGALAQQAELRPEGCGFRSADDFPTAGTGRSGASGCVGAGATEAASPSPARDRMGRVPTSLGGPRCRCFAGRTCRVSAVHYRA